MGALPDTLWDRLKGAFISTDSTQSDGAPALRLRAVGTTILGATTISSASANALAVGANGATNPVLQVDASVASVSTGLSITGAAAGGGVALAAISSGANEALSLAAKGAAALTFLTNSATRLTIGITGTVTIAAPSSGLGLVVSGGGGNVTGGLVLATGDFSVSLGTISSTVTSGDNPATVFANDIAGAAALVLKAGNGTTSSNAAYVSCQINATVAQRWDFGCVSSTSWSVKDVTRNASPLTINLTGNVTIAAPDSGTGLTVNGPTKLGRTNQADITTIYGYNEGSINTTVVLDNPGSTGSGTSLTFQTAEANRAVIDSTTAANGGGQLRLYTRNAAGSIVQRLAIASTGAVTIAAPDSGVALTISGGGLSVTGDLTIGDANNLILNATTGTKIGTATSQKLAFYNSAPVIQPVGAGQAAVIATAATQTTPWGYATQAQADAIVTLVNQLRADLVTLGLIKGAA